MNVYQLVEDASILERRGNIPADNESKAGLLSGFDDLPEKLDCPLVVWWLSLARVATATQRSMCDSWHRLATL